MAASAVEGHSRLGDQSYRNDYVPPEESYMKLLAATGAFAFAVTVLLGGPVPSGAQNWPQFRGAGSRGVSESDRLPDRWSATENVAWKTDIAGRGWSSPVVWGDRVFVTSVVTKGETEAPKKGLYFGGERPVPAAEHDWNVTCLDANTGKVRWQKTAEHGVPQGSRHLKNSFASETPVTDGKHVYAYFGNVGLFCYDFDGKLAWSKKLPAHKTRYGWGTAASPALHGERLYIVCDNDEKSELIALDKKTGADIWRVERDEKTNWSTPFIWQNDRRTEIVTAGSGKVRSYDLKGKLLWSLTGMSSITIATPYTEGGLLYITSGYVGDRLRPVYAIKPGAEGDITLKSGETSNSYIAWSNATMAPYNPSTLVYRGRLYVLHDRGLLSCYDAATGKPYYDKERLPQGSGFTSSPWAAGGLIYCLSEDGIAHVVRAGDKFELVRSNSLTDDDMCMATPALANNRLYIRTATRIYCIRQGAR
jgi:outer membrane protein assembly factor BamB